MNAPRKSPAGQAVKRHRERLGQAGLARFEVKAPLSDKALLRQVAKALTAGDDALREKIETALNPPPETRTKGRTLAALRAAAPFMEGVTFERIRSPMRKVDI